MSNFSDYGIYYLWLLIVGFFLCQALYYSLEKASKSKKVPDPIESLKQGLFIFVCVAICYLIDIKSMEFIQEKLSFISPPKLCVQFVMFPIVLTICAKLIGGSDKKSLKKENFRKKR